ncbi:uncharacterized protein LOC130187303 [Seriola aureovittata]|uniref:uncharacterized protein LOC130187303 n=1 Tax=Seriola aureovittata TaxID=2871759 RepID=UPI0024BDF06C|nr:uncharacterized protein LOC130187303 [Seriola aureovittata]
MSNTRLQTFRSFLTERFTTAAVEIFGEVETIVEAYYEENKRLRNILHMVLHPEIKLPRIDESQCSRITTDVREQPPKLNTAVDLEISEPLPKKPKEEQIECDISLGSQQQEDLGEVHNTFNPGCVKDDPDEEDTNIPCTANLFCIQVVDYTPNSSATLSADEANDEHDDNSSLGSDAVTDDPQPFKSEESASENWETQKHETSQTRKSRQSLQKTMLELPRMMAYKSSIVAPPDTQSFLARLTEAFKDVPDDRKPLITKMGLTAEVELVDCAFGKVPKGCPLSYQYPVPSSKDYKTYDNAPPRPLLPLSYHKLVPVSALPTLGAKEQEHVNVMQITWEEAHGMEHSTRGCKESVEELRKLRLTSRFRQICKLKPGQSHAEHLILKMRNGLSRCKTAQIEEETKSEALREYCQHMCVNWSPCGLVVNPDAPWLGALPDGLVYDPKEIPSFGMVHVKCVSFQSFIDCGFLTYQDGALKLRTTSSHYWHIQGEMMVTGMSWCDLCVISREDILVQRIYRNNALIKVMMKRLQDFFFRYYLPSLFHTGVTA